MWKVGELVGGRQSWAEARIWMEVIWCDDVVSWLSV